MLDRAVGRGDCDLAGARQSAVAQVARDFVLAKQPVDAFAQQFDNLLFAAKHRRQIEFHAGNFHAMFRQLGFRLGEFLARFQQRFAGNAANAQTRAAQPRFLIDAADVQAQLRGANGRRVTAGTAADDDQIVLGHGASLLRSIVAVLMRTVCKRIVDWDFLGRNDHHLAVAPTGDWVSCAFVVEQRIVHSLVKSLLDFGAMRLVQI